MTDYEFSKLLGYKKESFVRSDSPFFSATAPSDGEVDWVAKGAVTNVKDQGSCGSCWSFSTTGSVEGLEFVTTGKLHSMSEQQLVDCSFGVPYGNLGCSGGLMDSAFEYVMKYGLEEESVYPYNAKRDKCLYDASKVVFMNKVFKDVTPNSLSSMLAAVSVQPVSVAIQANQLAFQSYKTGVLLDNGKCGTNLDHGVLAVGFGTDKTTGVDYWKVKNSWGPSWGENGYIRIQRVDGAGVCGINMQSSFPTA